jgi:hypothetical protein
MKETPRHKKHEQKGKTTIIGLLLPEVLKKWLYMKWNWRRSQCPPETPPSQDRHLKQLRYHEPQPHACP